MTNPIMPGIEKLAEKYGIDVNRKPETPEEENNNFKIKITNKEYEFSGLISNILSPELYLSKNLLNHGQSFTPEDWLTKDIKLMNEKHFGIPSLPEYVELLRILNIHENGKYKSEIGEIKGKLCEDFTSYKILTSTVIEYDPFDEDVIIHHYDNTQTVYANLKTDLLDMFDICKLSKELTSVEADKLDWIFSLTKRNVYFKTALAKPDILSKKSVVLNLSENKFFIDLNHDMGSLVRARGIYQNDWDDVLPY